MDPLCLLIHCSQLIQLSLIPPFDKSHIYNVIPRILHVPNIQFILHDQTLNK